MYFNMFLKEISWASPLNGTFENKKINCFGKLNWSQIQGTDGIEMYVIGLSAPHEVPTAEVI